VGRDVLLLRGVNVGGRTLSMAALREALTAAGCTDVSTYIQSGNVILTPPKRAHTDDWFRQIVEEVAGYDVAVAVRSAAELARTVAKNPYAKASGTALHVVFFASAPPKSLLHDLELDTFAPEHCTLVGRDLYLNLPNGMGRAKLPIALEKAGRKLKPPALGTARNWNTVLKLAEMAKA